MRRNIAQRVPRINQKTGVNSPFVLCQEGRDTDIVNLGALGMIADQALRAAKDVVRELDRLRAREGSKNDGFGKCTEKVGLVSREWRDIAVA